MSLGGEEKARPAVAPYPKSPVLPRVRPLQNLKIWILNRG